MADNKNPGNFANDREKAAQAGQKGGQHSASHTTGTSHDKDQRDQHAKSGTHGGGNFADDRERAAEAGRKGGSR